MRIEGSHRARSRKEGREGDGFADPIDPIDPNDPASSRLGPWGDALPLPFFPPLFSIV